ncbi:MAG: NUDIX domain-containing protein [Phycisphaeraceae bacterium]|nr:NUDIX domain-containing protein [Phycisphaeraceae bacterium]
MAQIEFVARALLTHGQWLLLCRSEKRGYYYLPGGHIESGEAAADALSREWLEETGSADLRVGALAAIVECAFEAKKRRHHELNLVFHVEQRRAKRSATPPPICSAEPKIAFEWVRLHDLANHDMRPHAIADWLQHGFRRSRGVIHLSSITQATRRKRR